MFYGLAHQVNCLPQIQSINGEKVGLESERVGPNRYRVDWLPFRSFGLFVPGAHRLDRRADTVAGACGRKYGLQQKRGPVYSLPPGHRLEEQQTGWTQIQPDRHRRRVGGLVHAEAVRAVSANRLRSLLRYLLQYNVD